MPDPVLVVAADLHFAKVIERACASQGLESISADDGESALVALEFEKPIAVILENDLRDRMGTDLAKEIRSRPEGESLPIILLAGPMMPAAELTPRAVKVGVTCCLDSSIPPEHIAQGLRALLEGDSSVLGRLVNGEPLDDANEPTQLDDPPSGRQADKPDTRVRESDEDEPARTEGSIDIEVDDSIITGGKIKAPPIEAKPKHPPAKPRKGTLNDIPFAKLLAELKQEYATGALELAREKVKKTIWLSDGVPVSAKSNAMGETLGAVLVKMGKLSESQRVESVEKMQKEKKLHGVVLVELGIVKQKDVNSALQAQARAKVINCFAWDDGAYDFKPKDALPTDQPELKMSFGALIAAGVKQRYDLPRLRKVLLPHIGETPRFKEEYADVFAELKLEDAEKKFVETLRGRRSLAEVLALSDMDELDLHRVLVTAAFAGVVQFSPEGNVTRQYRLESTQAEPSQIGRDKPPAAEPAERRTTGSATREKTREPSVDLRDVEGEKTNVQDDEPKDVFGEKEPGIDFGAELGRELRAELEGDDEEEAPPSRPAKPAKPAPPPAKSANGKAAPKAARVPVDPAKEDTGPKPADDEPEMTEPPETRADPEVEAKINAALKRMRDQNYYDRLGTPTDALASTHKAAYLRLAKEYHPDRLVQDGGAGIKSKADELFAMISEAYHTLTDETKRKKYDDEVLRGIKDDASDEANAILNAEHQFLKGERLLKAGNVTKAFEAFAAAVELYPKESEYQACYGWTMFKMSHPSDMPKANEGEKIIRSALTMNARNDKAHLFLGQIARIKGNVDEAKKHFDKALEIQPDNVEAQRELRVLDMRESKKGGIGGLFRGGKK